jgi:translation initiation factor 2B subunit (eIF-2B alpha/beta/delta family)
MADPLKAALRGLRALAADHRSGAAEIADRAAVLLAEFCRDEPAGDPRLSYALGELADTTLRVHPSLAPLLRLANVVQLAAERGQRPLPKLRAALGQFRRQRQAAALAIARQFAARLRRRATILTYSHSSTVLAALSAARERVARVLVSEARPMLEGRLLAGRLAALGVPVTLVADAALPAQVAAADLLVVGADAVLASGYINKVGTRLLQDEAGRAGKPFLILADTAKFLPPALAALHRIEEEPAAELWREAPAGVAIVNRYFETIPYERPAVLVTERGVLSPTAVRAFVKRLPVARRWQEARAEPRA